MTYLSPPHLSLMLVPGPSDSAGEDNRSKVVIRDGMDVI